MLGSVSLFRHQTISGVPLDIKPNNYILSDAVRYLYGVEFTRDFQ